MSEPEHWPSQDGKSCKCGYIAKDRLVDLGGPYPDIILSRFEMLRHLEANIPNYFGPILFQCKPRGNEIKAACQIPAHRLSYYRHALNYREYWVSCQCGKEWIVYDGKKFIHSKIKIAGEHRREVVEARCKGDANG